MVEADFRLASPFPRHTVLRMRSMTGFGRGSATAGTWQATVEISSVNRKQAEIVVQTPRELNELESRIRKATLNVVSRGRAQVTVNLEQTTETETEVQVDATMAKAFRAAIEKINEATGQSLELSASDYLRQPGMVSLGSNDIDPEAAWQAIEPALDLALKALADMRQSEGDHLKEDFDARLTTLKSYAASIEKQAPERPIRQKELLLKRLKDADLDLDPSDERVVKELAIFADRCDISEEITRLHSHFTKFNDYLESGEPIGRSLDFLCQELFREFNTIGSKANDAEIAQTIVEAKTELEKIREQVQNAE